ncbi:MAG: hypothetical protein K0R82_2276 [Flavipsychrobacter sp.]|jgi:hypothetical protein|nr:hypothetical protein [Flavipsychrobacter sp.]
MRAKEWVEQAERTYDNGKRQFTRQKLIDALERMTDEQVNSLCSDIMHTNNSTPPADGAHAIAGERLNAPAN